MGTAIDRKFFRTRRTAIPQALFFLQSDRLLPADAASVNLGIAIPEAMRNVPPAKQPQVLQSTVERLLDVEFPDVILRRIDILFDPVWHIDALKLLLAVGRNRRIYVLWPGVIKGNILEYAEQGRPDYKRFDLSGYVDAYIVMK